MEMAVGRSDVAAWERPTACSISVLKAIAKEPLMVRAIYENFVGYFSLMSLEDNGYIERRGKRHGTAWVEHFYVSPKGLWAIEAEGIMSAKVIR